MSVYDTEPICTLTAKEAQAFAAFIIEHELSMKCTQDVNLEFSIGSGIGRNTWVKCECGAEADITDYSTW